MFLGSFCVLLGCGLLASGSGHSQVKDISCIVSKLNESLENHNFFSICDINSTQPNIFLKVTSSDGITVKPFCQRV